MTAKYGQMVHRGGPQWSKVRRRVTLDVSRGILLQDLKDVQSASEYEIKFPIPAECSQIETVFYYVKDGHSWHLKTQRP